MENGPQGKIDAIAKKPRGEAPFAELLQGYRGEIAKALPRNLDPDRMLRIALTAFRKNPMLQECTQQSLLGAIITSAQLGLECDGILGHAYLVPYMNGKTRRMEAQLQIGYRGFIALALRGGHVKSIFAECVYENDYFKFRYGSEPHIHHVPSLKDRGEFVAAYAIAELTAGGNMFRVLPSSEIDKARSRSKKDKNGEQPVWREFFDEMARKTAVRNLSKYVAVDVELSKAAVREEYRDAEIESSGYEIDFNVQPAKILEAPKDEDTSKNSNNVEDVTRQA